MGTASPRYVAKMEDVLSVMEDVLSVYELPYDAKRPVLCIDEGKKEVRSTPKGDVPMKVGQVKREDYEYVRAGASNLFLTVEPLVGRRMVAVTERRTRVDFAPFLKRISDAFCPHADKIVIVLDNLNPHNPWWLYTVFEPDEACRLMNRFAFHYPPEHGSWLNVAEIELSVMPRQCLNLRISRSDIVADVSAWEIARNELRGTVKWQFTTRDARVKRRRLYPELQKTEVQEVGNVLFAEGVIPRGLPRFLFECLRRFQAAWFQREAPVDTSRLAAKSFISPGSARESS